VAVPRALRSIAELVKSEGEREKIKRAQSRRLYTLISPSDLALRQYKQMCEQGERESLRRQIKSADRPDTEREERRRLKKDFVPSPRLFLIKLIKEICCLLSNKRERDLYKKGGGAVSNGIRRGPTQLEIKKIKKQKKLAGSSWDGHAQFFRAAPFQLHIHLSILVTFSVILLRS